MTRAPRRTKAAVTIRTVAERAGVSAMTVSNVLHGRTVAAQTRETVLRAVRELNYKPAATAAHQVEGSNLASDLWLVENVKPTMFREPSGDALDSFELWPADLDLVRSFGLNTYRFSLEWARIEPGHGPLRSDGSQSGRRLWILWARLVPLRGRSPAGRVLKHLARRSAGGARSGQGRARAVSHTSQPPDRVRTLLDVG